MRSALVILSSLMALSSQAFYARCQGPGEMEILIASHDRNVQETQNGLHIEDSHIDLKLSAHQGYQSAWGTLKIEGKTLSFESDRIILKSEVYNSLEGFRNQLLLDGEVIFEDIDLTCTAKR